MKKLLVRVLQALAAGALIGSLAGLARAVGIIATNDYFHFDLDHLAAKVLFGEISQGTVTGIVIAAATVAVVLIAYPFAWLLRRKRERAWGGALAAPVVLVVSVLVAYHINRHYLPGILTLPSMLANAGMAVAVVAVWFAAARAFDRLAAAAAPRAILRGAAFVAVPAVLIALFLSQSATWLFTPSPQAEGRPNVLLIMIDALRADRMSAYGHSRETTPNLDRLAADGVLFTQAISQATWTKPSVASLFTSMYPRQHGIASSDWGRPDAGGQTRVDTLNPKVLTLAEALSNAGYRTAAIGENNHLTPKTDFDQGFDTFEMKIDPDEHWTRAPEMNRRFRRWINRHGDDDFFVYLHYIDVHWPYKSPPPFKGMYAGPPATVDYNRLGFVPEHNAAPPTEFDPELLEHMLATYDEGIRFIDDQIGEVIDELKERGLYDETLIVVISDHGDEFREHGKFAHGESLFDEVIHVPLIIKFPCPGPNCRQQTVTDQVETIDVMPTILESAGIPLPAGLFGRHVFSDSPDPEPAAFSELDNQVALRTPQHKYIYAFDSGAEQLYDLTADPAEKRNLAAEQPELAEGFRSRIFGWIEVVDTGLSVISGQVELDEESKKRLEALGYVE